jgi:thiol-disulfide isomerase/thioredoxin
VKRGGALLIIWVLGGITALFVSAFPGFPEAGSTRAAEIRDGGGSRDPEVVDMGGARVSFSSFLGQKPLMVVFWATWCPECRKEVPALNRLASDPSINLLAVNVGEKEQKVRSFIASYHVVYPVVRDPGWQTTAAFGVMGIPACILLDKGGEVLYRGSAVPGEIGKYVRR